ncbi:2-C-methyl-D-erythritol 4-phosphate cytidylyltransferase [bacterium]|nr:2-C-methyl-D-erythritol 4-phosphate cytidylyltransferase [bacterium]
MGEADAKSKTYAVVVAGGSGTRMGADTPKQYLMLARRPILARTLEVFEKSAEIDAVIIVVPRGFVQKTRDEIVHRYNFPKVRYVVQGGRRRQNSVFNGLKAIRGACDVVAIHDGVRPLVTPDLIDKSVRVARNFGAAIVAYPVTSTIKIISHDGFVDSTPERRYLMAAQTPQTFQYPVLMKAYEQAMATDFRATDDSQLVERLGVKPIVVQGSRENIKITTTADLELAECIFRTRKAEAKSNGSKKTKSKPAPRTAKS